MIRSKPMSRGASQLARKSATRITADAGLLRVQAVDLKAKAERKAAKSKSMPKRLSASATPAERHHMGLVADLGCCLCRHLGIASHAPAEVHHVRINHGWGRSGHFNTIPLCRLHHRGQPGGIHDMGREQFTVAYGVSEFDLLAMTNQELGVAL